MGSPAFLCAGMALLLAAGHPSSFRLELGEVLTETIEALLPEPSVGRRPLRDLAQRPCVQMAGTPLRLPAARDEACALEHTQVLRDGRATDREWRRELRDRRWPPREPREDRAPRGVGKGRQGRAQAVRGVIHLTGRLSNPLVPYKPPSFLGRLHAPGRFHRPTRASAWLRSRIRMPSLVFLPGAGGSMSFWRPV